MLRKDGYHLDPLSRQCRMLQCGCENGQGTIGADCPGFGWYYCESCNDGYYLDTNTGRCEQCAYGSAMKDKNVSAKTVGGDMGMQK